MARDVPQKLRLTAAVLGTVARKDLAAAFRRVNANTAFEIGRADKWLQGRAQPRELQIYEDWSKVLELDRPGQWVADCDINSFLDEICSRHGLDRTALLQSTASKHPNNEPGSALHLAGTFACYSHAWSPYFRGRLIRGVLTVDPASSRSRLPATYTEVLPTGPMKLKGVFTIGSRSTMHLQVSDTPGGAPILTFSLFPAAPPASILAGLMFGTTIIGPDIQPSVTRIVMVRMPEVTLPLAPADAYLPPQGSISDDLAALGLDVENAAAVDQQLTEFLFGGSGGFDQVPVAQYRALADIFDRVWLSGSS